MNAKAIYRARYAFKAYHESANSPARRIAGAALFDPVRNPDLADNLADMIADALILAKAQGLDALAITSAALSHVAGLDSAYYAVGRVIAAQAEAADPYCSGCGADLRGEDHKDSCDLDDDAKAATLARWRPTLKAEA